MQRQREEVFRLKHQREVGEEEEAQLKARPIAACATCRMQHTHDMCTTGYILYSMRFVHVVRACVHSAALLRSAVIPTTSTGRHGVFVSEFVRARVRD